jgi:TfoX/Sxy family transcriptional regulator of competence genes
LVKKTPSGAAFDPKLLERIRALLADQPGVVERRMFGGVCFMVNGRMCCGTTKTAFLVRVGKLAFAEAVREPHARPMQMGGRVSNATVLVDPAGYASKAALARWLKRGLAFVANE